MPSMLRVADRVAGANSTDKARRKELRLTARGQTLEFEICRVSFEARRKRVAQRSDRVALLRPRTLQRVPTTTPRALRVSPSNPHHPERHMRAYGPASHNHQPKSELSSTKRPREHRLTQLSRCALPSRQAVRANPRAEALQAVRQNQPRATSSRSRELGQASGPTEPTACNVQPKPETRPSKRADRTNRLQPPAEAGS